MYLKIFITAVLILSCTAMTAQVKKKIKKSRRNKSESQFALQKKDILFEWEAGNEVFNNTLSTASIPNMILHYGISNRLEVNTEMSIVTVTDKTAVTAKNISGAEPLLAGFNYLLRKETKNGPAIIATMQLALPFLASKNFTATHLAPLAQFDIQQPLSKKLTMGFTPGIFWDGFITAPSYSYSAQLAYKPQKKWVLMAEVFGFAGHDAPQHNIDAEADYSVSKHWVLGITGGFGINAAAHKSYTGINGSFSFSSAKKRQLQLETAR